MSYSETLTEKRDALLAKAEQITAIASDEKRELTADEDGEIAIEAAQITRSDLEAMLGLFGERDDQLATLIDNWQAFVNKNNETRDTDAAFDWRYVQAVEECLGELRAVVEGVEK